MTNLIGQIAPDFTAAAVLGNGEITAEFNLHKTIKNKYGILVFYPLDFTFVCPTELGDLADHYAQLQKLGVEVYSVSTDTHFTHKAWHDASDTIRKIQDT